MADNEIHSGISILSVRGKTGIVQICSDKKNHITIPEFVEIKVLNNWIRENDLLAVVITGSGRHFSNGADFTLIEGSDNSETAFDELHDRIEKGRELLTVIETLPVVTVAAINGSCFGAGLEIALSCNFRICSGKSFFALPEASRGIIPGLNGVERFSALCGRSKAIRFALSGEMINAEDALASGIVDMIAEDSLDAAVKFAEELTDNKSFHQVSSIVNASGMRSEPRDFVNAVKEMISNG